MSTSHPSQLASTLGLDVPGVVAVAGSGGKTTLVEALAAELAAAGAAVAIAPTTRIYPPPASLCGPAWLWGEGIPTPREIEDRLRPGRVLAVAAEMDLQGKLRGLGPGQVAALAGAGDSAAWVLVEADGAARKPLKAWAPHEPAWPEGEGPRLVVAGARGLGRPLSPELVHRARRFARAAGLEPGQPITPAALARVLLGPEGPFREAPPAADLTLVVNQVDTASPPLVAALGREVTAVAAERGLERLRVLAGRLRWGRLEPLEPAA